MREDVAKNLLGFGANGVFVFKGGGKGHMTNKNVWASFS
jgi:hypothetical protein